MGVVYRAIDTRLNRTVALKVIAPDVIADPHRKRRFVREARAASALSHPNIVTVYDIGEIDGVDFIAMELVSGQSARPADSQRRPAARAHVEMPSRCDGTRGRARGRHRSPRHQAGEHHGDRHRAREGARFRACKAFRSNRRSGSRPSRRRSRAKRASCLARWPTCRPSRRRAFRLTIAPTSSRLAPCCMKWSRAAGVRRRDLDRHTRGDLERAAAAG